MIQFTTSTTQYMTGTIQYRSYTPPTPMTVVPKLVAVASRAVTLIMAILHLLAMALLSNFCLQVLCKSNPVPICAENPYPAFPHTDPEDCIELIRRVMRNPKANDEIWWRTDFPEETFGRLPLEDDYKSCHLSLSVAPSTKAKVWIFSLASLIRPLFHIFDTCIMKISECVHALTLSAH